MQSPYFLILQIVLLSFLSCSEVKEEQPAASTDEKKEIASDKIPVIFDTDANNELDDQHALAYLLANQAVFEIEGITVNTTYNGGRIDKHYEEAERVMKLCNSKEQFPLLKGADASYEEIVDHLETPDHDGVAAVDFIIKKAKDQKELPLVVLAVGKLTTVALAVKKDPSIIEKIRLVWLGSNYPEDGEYNLENDIPAMNFLLNTSIPFEMVVARYGKPSGTDAVKVTKEEIHREMPGLGPQASSPVIGRHGKSFKNFGDYSLSLFEHIDYYGDPPARALFDMAAVAIVKNKNWAEASNMPAPLMQGKKWQERANNKREIVLWENFDRSAIMIDFYQSLRDFK